MPCRVSATRRWFMVAGESSLAALWAVLIEVSRRVIVAAFRGLTPAGGLASEAR